MWIQPTIVYDQPEGTTAMDVFRQVLTANGYTYEAKGSYVQAVIKPTARKWPNSARGRIPAGSSASTGSSRTLP